MARGGFLVGVGHAIASLVPSPPRVGVAYALLFDAAGQAQSIDEALLLLGREERSRAARFHFERDRTTYVLAHAIWRRLLGRCLGVPAADVPLRFAASGQPQLPGTGWATSLSHSGTQLLLAAARADVLGVDIECAPASARLDALAAEICAPVERDLLQALPAAARRHALLRLWTRKEALLKAAGVGLGQPPSSFAAPADEPVMLPGMPAAQFCVVHDLAPLPPTCAGAWAAPSAVRELSWRRVGRSDEKIPEL